MVETREHSLGLGHLRRENGIDKISAKFHVPTSSVGAIIKKHTELGTVTNKLDRGRKRIFFSERRERRIARIVTNNPRQTTEEITMNSFSQEIMH